MDTLMEQALKAGGIRTPQDLMNLLAAKDDLKQVETLLRAEARAEAEATFGAEAGALYASNLHNMGGVAILALRNAWRGMRLRGDAGTVHAGAQCAAQHSQAGGSAWARLTPKQQEQATRLNPNATPEQKEALALQFLKDRYPDADR